MLPSSFRFPRLSRNLCCLTAFLFTFFCSLRLDAQTTTVSGTVFDPRTTTSSLPIPNVLVYVTTGTVAPLPTGVQCLTFSAPKDAVSYTYTAVDGTFTIDKVPLNTSYTLVIQAGKWRRQFALNLGATAVTGLQLHMPANHTQGDIPLIAVDTGSVDGVECVLHDMGIDDSEFTDDTGSVNPGGRIHLYLGAGSPGAQISSSTPVESALMGDMTKLNSYDMVMFPCQGSSNFLKSSTSLQNLVTYANAGGRVFTTHYSYVWLDPDAPFSAQFPPVVKWHPGQNNPNDGVATINTGFTDGATLAQWLQNAGASYNNQQGQILINTLRHDFDSVIPPTQAWLTRNDPSTNNPIQQMTFNTPVGAPAAAQCGRVLFNEYHVINISGATGKAYPQECPVRPMTAQEEMLEYALFDLSAFVQPVVIPTLSVKFDPDPLVVKQNDSADKVTIAVTNTSSNTAIDPSAVLKISLPANLTATALSDATGGWICTVMPLQCTRQSSIGSSTTDSVTLTVAVGTYPSGSPTSALITATISSPTFSNDVVATDPVIFQQPPAITWATPAPIVFGTPLSAVQLNATSPLSGAFTYDPAAGTVLTPGQHTLSTSFAPADTVNYTVATATVTLKVVPAVPSVSVNATPNPAFIQNPVVLASAVTSAAGAPTGSVTFLDGTAQLGSGSITGGAASYTTSGLTLGKHSISAAYAGDTLFNGAASNSVDITLEDFKIEPSGKTASDNTVTIYPGSTAVYYLMMSPVGGATLAGDVSVTIDGLPANAHARFSASIVRGNSGPTPIQVDVTTPGIAENHTPQGPFDRSLPVVFGLMLLPFARRLRSAARRWHALALVVAASAMLLWGATGCGVTYTPKPYTLTIKATAGSLTHTTSVKLIIK